MKAQRAVDGGIEIGARMPRRFSPRHTRSASLPLVIAVALLVAAPAAVAAPGDLDPTLGVGGQLTTDFGMGANVPREVVDQPDGKIVVGGANGDGNFALARYNSGGSLDTSFSGDGKVTTSFLSSQTPYSRGATDIALQTDGKIIAVGYSLGGFALARYNSDGSLDPTFSEDGKQTTFLGSGFGLSGVALQPDGKIVAVGVAGGSDNFTVVRYQTDGSLDTSFSGDGMQIVGFGGMFSGSVAQLALQPDGKIVAVGSSGETGYDFAVARLNADGSLDTSFSGDGKETTDFGSGGELAYDVALQPDSKIVVSGVSNFDFALARYNSDGSLDTSFSGDGKVTTSFPSFYGAANMDLQPDGKIVVAGYGPGTFGSSFGAVRYNSDGLLDASFSGDGKQTIDLSDTFHEAAQAIVVQPSDKLVIVGYVGNDFGLTRLNADGSLDASLSGDGKQTTDLAGGIDAAFDVAIQSDGKIVTSGTSSWGTIPAFSLARYNADGSLDTSFSADGMVSNEFDSGTAAAVAIQSDGKIVAAGDNQNGDFKLARYNADGSFDAGFAGGGSTTTNFEDSAYGHDLALQANGRIIVAGESGFDFALARYNADGSLDTTFSGDGLQTTDIAGSDVGYGMALQGDGKIVVVGRAGFEDGVGVARYNPDGSLDTSFSVDGIQTIDFGGAASEATAVSVQPDGKIVVVGNAGNFDFGLARLNPDGSLDTTFSGDGKQTTNFSELGTTGGQATDVTLQSDGRIVVVGTSDVEAFATGGSFAIARYNPDGSLDTSFAGDGRQSTEFGDKGAIARGVALQGDGAIVLAGGAHNDFALTRYVVGGSVLPEEEPTPPLPDEGSAPSPAVGSSQPILPTGTPPKPTPGTAFFARVGQVKGGKALIRTRCVGDTACRGVAKLIARVTAKRAVKRGGNRRLARRARNVVIGKSRFNIPAGKRGVVRIKLTGTGRKLLKKAGKRGLRVQLVGSGLKKRSVKLKPQVRKRSKRR